jgi:hypothetical protein
MNKKNMENVLTYKEKEEIANKYLNNLARIDWDDLDDINSLHDAETTEEIQTLCDDRLSASGFYDIID